MSHNRFDEYYEIRLALYEEIPAIMAFIEKYWKKGHILARDRSFFEYEMTKDGKVNFVIAKVKRTGEIDGVLGFLPCSNSVTKLDAWGVIWKTKDGALPMLGIEMKKRFYSLTGARTDLGTGANLSTSVPLLSRIMHYYTAKMKHYYRLNDKDDYIIPCIVHKDIPAVEVSNAITVLLLKGVDDLASFFDFTTVESSLPYKDLWYYNKRFFEHPIYQYQIWGVSDGKAKSFFITRVQRYEGAAVLNIVDYVGDASLFSYCGGFFDNLLHENNYEYVDFYFDGFDEKTVMNAGFVEVVEDDTNIIPTYFNPFVRKNIDIYVDSSNKDEKFLFFKADGDQDRPS